MSALGFVFTPVPASIRRRTDLSGDAKVLFAHLLDRQSFYAASGGTLFESKRILAAEIGRTEKVLEVRLRELVDVGLLAIEQRPGRTAVYRVEAPATDPPRNGTHPETGPTPKRDRVAFGTDTPPQMGPTPPTVSGGHPPSNGTPNQIYSDPLEVDRREGEPLALASAPAERMLRSLVAPTTRDAEVVRIVSERRIAAGGGKFRASSHTDRDAVARLREWADEQSAPSAALVAALDAFFVAKGTGARLSWLVEEDPGRYLGSVAKSRASNGYRPSPPADAFRDDDSELVALEQRTAQKRAARAFARGPGPVTSHAECERVVREHGGGRGFAEISLL